MSTYTPDRFVIIEITVDKEKIFKVLGGWSGGYLSSDSWRMNSGIVSYSENDNTIQFHGNSGSVYNVYRRAEGVSFAMSPVVNQLNDPNVPARIVEWEYAKTYLEEVNHEV